MKSVSFTFAFGGIFPMSLLLVILCASSFARAADASAPATAPLASAPVSSTAKPGKERSRLEELFIWKASEELKLPPKEETKFTEIIHSLNASRRQAGDEMEAAVKLLDEAKSKAEIEKALGRHRAALKHVQAVQLAELDRLRPLLGPEKMARYLVVKTSLLEKLKSLLSSPSPTASTSPASR